MHILFFSSCFFDLPEPRGRNLAAQAELGDERPVALDVFFLQVLEQPTPLADHLEQALTRVVIVLVLAQVLGKMRYAPREHRDLHLRRPRVALVRPVLPYYLFFTLHYRQLLFLLFCSISTYSTLYATTCIKSYRSLSAGPLPRPALSAL